MEQNMEQALEKAVVRAVEQAISGAAQRGSFCGCNLSPESREEMGHLTGMVKDLGDGDMAQGVEAMRENHKCMSKMRTRAERIGMAVQIAVIGLLAVSLARLLWEALSKKLGSGQ